MVESNHRLQVSEIKLLRQGTSETYQFANKRIWYFQICSIPPATSINDKKNHFRVMSVGRVPVTFSTTVQQREQARIYSEYVCLLKAHGQ